MRFGCILSCAPVIAHLSLPSLQKYLFYIYLAVFNPNFDHPFCPNAPETGFLLELCQYYLEYVNDLSLLIFFYLSQGKN